MVRIGGEANPADQQVRGMEAGGRRIMLTFAILGGNGCMYVCAYVAAAERGSVQGLGLNAEKSRRPTSLGGKVKSALHYTA